MDLKKDSGTIKILTFYEDKRRRIPLQQKNCGSEESWVCISKFQPISAYKLGKYYRGSIYVLKWIKKRQKKKAIDLLGKFRLGGYICLSFNCQGPAKGYCKACALDPILMCFDEIKLLRSEMREGILL